MAETALITGASSGIGLELARCFARHGSDLVLVARDEARLRSLADELRQTHGVGTRVLPADLSRADAPDDIQRELEADGVEVDVVVNNAGFGARGPVAELPLEAQLDMVQVNVAALTRLSRLFLPGMLARRRGGVLNVGSTAGFQAGPNMTVYYATKAYVLSFTEGLAEELRGSGVVATLLAPGPTHTDFVARAKMEGIRLFKLGAMSAARVAEEGHAGFRAGRTIVIPGGRNLLGAWTMPRIPRAAARRITQFLQS